MKRESRQEHNPVESSSEETAMLASKLAPLEEQEAAAGGKRNGGSILLDTAQLKLPKGVIEEEDRQSAFHLEPVVLFIILLAVAFIAFIAYLISLEPSK
jgi:hypothetical protein